MRVTMLTREYPPQVYGGAGVHVEFLVRHLQGLCQVAVHSFAPPGASTALPNADHLQGASTIVSGNGWPAGDHLSDHHGDFQRKLGLPAARMASADDRLAGSNPALRALSVDLQMAAQVEAAHTDVIHSHTWYATMAGHVASMLHGIAHVITAHSLEPLRPWKAAQLGEGGYRLSCWMERNAFEHAAAIIAVSHGMARDIVSCYPQLDPQRVHVVTNGVDTQEYAPDFSDEVHRDYGIDLTRPYVLFVGRVTPQKGLDRLLAVVDRLDPHVQVVLSVGAADTDQLWRDSHSWVQRLQQQRSGVLWIDTVLSREHLVQLFTRAAVFVCPSVYEPLGLVNVEAMACGTAVVASAVGGIPEVVDHGVTGLLIPNNEQDSAAYQQDLFDALSGVLADEKRAAAMGQAGLERVREHFSWSSRAEQTVQVYRQAVASQARGADPLRAAS